MFGKNKEIFKSLFIFQLIFGKIKTEKPEFTIFKGGLPLSNDICFDLLVQKLFEK